MPLFMHMKKQADMSCFVHGIDENDIRLEIEDQGKGIENIEQAMQPFYTSHPEQERTGMGFALMQSFMDHVRVQSSLGNGTIVFMQKRLHENDE